MADVKGKVEMSSPAKSTQCAEHVFDSRDCRDVVGYACTRTAQYREDGKDWCWQHRPSYVVKKRRKKHEKYETERRSSERRDKRRDLEAKVIEAALCHYRMKGNGTDSETAAFARLNRAIATLAAFEEQA